MLRVYIYIYIITIGQYYIIDYGFMLSSLLEPNRDIPYYVKKYDTDVVSNHRELFDYYHAHARNKIKKTF